MKFNEIASSDELTQALVLEINKYSPLLAQYIEFFSKPGSAVSVRGGGSKSDIVGTTRALGSEYPAKTVSPTYKTVLRKLLGDTIKIDVALERMGSDISSEMMSQLKQRMRDFGTMFNYNLVNGNPTTTATEFTGVKNLVTDDYTITAAANGLTLKLGNSDTAKSAQQAFLEKLDEAIIKCQGVNKVVFTNSRVLARLNAIAREYIQIIKNDFGVPIMHYNHIPLIDMGDYEETKGVFKPVVGFDETVGTSIDCSSLYVASFEEEQGLSFATCEGGFTVYPIQKVGNFQECMFELIIDSVLVRDSALVKLSGLKL